VKITHISQVPVAPVTLPDAAGCACRVALSARDGAPTMALRVFEVAPGGHTPLHRHPYEHEIYVLNGAGTVWRDGQEAPLHPGDVLLIPADEPHQFKNTGAGTFQFICLIPVQFQKC